jgi:hypothetical protein
VSDQFLSPAEQTRTLGLCTSNRYRDMAFRVCFGWR